MPQTREYPTQQELQARYRYEPDTGKLFNRKTGRELKGKSHGYILVKFNKTVLPAHRVIWIIHYGSVPTDMEIDHINNNRSDNRIENLRLCTNSQNAMNAVAKKGRRFKGVSKSSRNTFVARITIDYKRIFLGNFPNPEEAHQAYLKAAEKYFGKFAYHLNQWKA